MLGSDLTIGITPNTAVYIISFGICTVRSIANLCMKAESLSSVENFHQYASAPCNFSSSTSCIKPENQVAEINVSQGRSLSLMNKAKKGNAQKTLPIEMLTLFHLCIGL